MPTAYRVEVSPNNRAGCKGSPACKRDAVKLQKGEIRFGTLVTILEHQSWQWRHWGCVTPKVIEHVKDLSGGDLDLFDGYEELPPAMQAKIKKALDQGHVDDEDWKGDPEYNRPGMNGFESRAKKAKAKEEEADGSEEEPPQKGRKRKKGEGINEINPSPNAKKLKGKVKKAGDVDDVATSSTKSSKPKNGVEYPAKKRSKVRAEESEENSKIEQNSKPKEKKIGKTGKSSSSKNDAVLEEKAEKVKSKTDFSKKARKKSKN